MRQAVLAAAMLVWVAPAFAQDYPTRPVRIIVPTPAGGPVDVMARVLGNALPAFLGQNVFIENKPGAGNTIGSRQAAAADPDGYTLMVSAASGLIIARCSTATPDMTHRVSRPSPLLRKLRRYL
jgi:tripartite-type tricarboxylate transporter receptor subunit TctC